MHQQVIATAMTANRVRHGVNLVATVREFCMQRYLVTVIPTRLYDDQYKAPNVIVVKIEQQHQSPERNWKIGIVFLEQIDTLSLEGDWESTWQLLIGY